MSDSRWLKSWLEVNESHYKGIGKDMMADIYADDGNDEEKESE